MGGRRGGKPLSRDGFLYYRFAEIALRGTSYGGGGRGKGLYWGGGKECCL